MLGHDLIGATFFCLALHYKQMSLYYALPFFCYLLGTCLKLPWTKRIAKFLKLSCVVLIVSGICWMPFLRNLDDTLAVVERLFPFSRGLYEDKVANIWCMLSIAIKWKSIFSTPTLVKISAFCTLLAVLPSSIHLLRNPSLHKLRLSLCREDFVSVTIKNLQMRTTYADGIGCLKKQDVCAKRKLAEGHMFQQKTLKEFTACMNEDHGNRRTKAVGSYKCHKNRYGEFSERG
ncbi:Dolichyl pyrophosphate Man9GlcNAc2 alpha-1,3-glucosyltransferase [Araneus ventricosus]|uniref:Alpha-1,3-glucosyltransferase n=1 Tax=Araneus ventricosus TaxID=182803 RepID=A0A4Y2LC57_ARAVE|nr:Dolichyl pyrophosphate Man9GlcNAc2 alpha-1,3-glucosyltransferase [Araneus ventricosus]